MNLLDPELSPSRESERLNETVSAGSFEMISAKSLA